MPESTYQTSSTSFRQHLPDLSTPRFQLASTQSPYEYSQHFQGNRAPPWLHDLTETWSQLLSEPYTGLQTSGPVDPSLFSRRLERVPVAKIASAARGLLALLTETQREKVLQPIGSRNWRAWSNPEVLLRPLGLRLEEISRECADAVLRVIEASLSPEGYKKALAAMRINGFLGEVCKLPRIMNALSYNFLIFGDPGQVLSDGASNGENGMDGESGVSPGPKGGGWGWSLYGHHLCMNVFIIGDQISISPTFTGAEPNVIDEGPYAGTEILKTEGERGLGVMRSLTPQQQQKAQVYKELKDPAMKITGDLISDRWNPDDQRHLCGAFRDNRVLPREEGVRVGELGEGLKEAVVKLVEEFVIYLPEQARRKRLEDVRRHLGETWFSWIGGWGEEDAFYYRVQSPVVVAEFDHHSGVFLTNKEPKRFHIHSIVRTPNGGDYGNALRREEDKVE